MAGDLKLKAITLENLSQVTVAPSSTNTDRSYGRRFTVAIGNDSHEVVLKDLFKRAQKLAKTATSASELNEVNKFIAKLEVAETAAALIYNDRDDSVYKFRSWFHRFFGGAFFGSHLDRLGTLKTKVDSKQEILIESFKTFFQENQLTFQSFVDKPIEIKIDDQTFDVKAEISAEGLVFQIQKKEDLGTAVGLLTIKRNNLNESVFEYEGQADGVPLEFSLVLGEISKEVEARVIKGQELQRTLTLLRSVIDNMNEYVTKFDFEGKEYELSRDATKMHLQEKIHKGTQIGLLSIQLNPRASNRAEIEFEGNAVSTIPETMNPVFDAVVLKAYERSSIYSRFGIRVVREGIKHIPEWHLNELCKGWEEGRDLRVNFLTDTLDEEEGIDAGGVKRDYIATIAASLQGSEALFTSIDGSLKLPRILRETQDPIFYCNEAEARTYHNLGILFSRCHQSGDNLNFGPYERELITTGMFFSDALFKAALSLEASDFAENGIPKQEVYIKIAKVLLTHLDTAEVPTIKNIIKCLDLTQETLPAILDPSNPDLYQAVLLAGEDAYTDDNGDPDAVKINSDPKKFIEDLRAGIFKDTGLIDELKGVPLGAMLDPVYQVAKGLKNDTNSWNDFRNNDPVEVSNRVQGSIDRDKIVASITCDAFSFTVSKKAGWLREWVKDEATDEELKAFLKFVTGGASLPEGKQLKITAQAVSQPFPTVCTCGLGISVSDQTSYSGWKKEMWDNKKEGFIRNLKQAMVVEGFQMG